MDVPTVVLWSEGTACMSTHAFENSRIIDKRRGYCKRQLKRFCRYGVGSPTLIICSSTWYRQTWYRQTNHSYSSCFPTGAGSSRALSMLYISIAFWIVVFSVLGYFMSLELKSYNKARPHTFV